VAQRVELRRGEAWWHWRGLVAWAVRSDGRLEWQGRGVWLLGQLLGLDGHAAWEKGKKEVGHCVVREKREGGDVRAA
jgi:hypothetical protein